MIYAWNLIIQILLLSFLTKELFINIYISYLFSLVYTTIANYILIKKFVFHKSWVVTIALSWNSGTWKSSLTKLIVDALWKHKSTILLWDASHKWERWHKNWNTITHLNPQWNHLDEEIKAIQLLKKWADIKRKFYDHRYGKFSKQTIIQKPNKYIIYEWLHWLYGKLWQEFDIKIFIESNNAEKNRLSRDIKMRNRWIHDLKKNIQKRQEDYKTFILPQKKNADIIINYTNITQKNKTIKIDFRFNIPKQILKLSFIERIYINKKQNYIEIPWNITLFYRDKIKLFFLCKKFFILYSREKCENKILQYIFSIIIKTHADNNTNGMKMNKV